MCSYHFLLRKNVVLEIMKWHQDSETTPDQYIYITYLRRLYTNGVTAELSRPTAFLFLDSHSEPQPENGDTTFFAKLELV